MESVSQEKVGKHKHRQRIDTSRSIQITGRGGHNIYASANIDESGEYDDIMKEWTVQILTKNHAQSCALDLLASLEIRIGGSYLSSFTSGRDRIDIRVYTVRSQGEKSFSITIGNELVLLGRVRGWPEARSPETDDDEEFNGTLETLLAFLQSGSLGGVELLIGCVVFKKFILGSLAGKQSIEELPTNWETFA